MYLTHSFCHINTPFHRGTVDQMLNGKEFNRATRAFVLAYEALSVSWLSAFFSWCNKNDFRIEYFATLFQWH
jgi:hypothetical protein